MSLKDVTGAVISAAKVCEKVRHEMGSMAMKKQDGTPVTIADFASQAVICQAIKKAFPNDPVVAEEDAGTLKETDQAHLLGEVTRYVSDILPVTTPDLVISWIDHGNGKVGPRYWALDPIDGTKGFIRGEQYAVALALIEEGDIKLGIMACPWLLLRPDDTSGERGVLFVAIRGEGTTMSPLSKEDVHPVEVANPDDPALLRFAESVESDHSDHTQQVQIAKSVGIEAPSLRMDGQVKYGAVARGEAALYLRLPLAGEPPYREKVWDHAAGTIIVEEAGGKVTDMNGCPLDLFSGKTMENNLGIIVSNGDIHERVLEALGQGEQNQLA